MNCPRCNASLAPNAKFCGSCGYRMDAAPNQAQSSPNFGSSGSAQPVQPNFGQSQGNSGGTSSGYNPQLQNTYQNPAGSAFRFDADGRGQGRGYTWEIQHPGSFALAIVTLQSGQSISAEAGAMVSMSGNVDLQSQMKGGIFGALKRAVGGESAFVSTFTAQGAAGEVTLAPGAPGDIVGIEMNNQTFSVQGSSYLAGDTSLQVETKMGGFNTWFGGEGLFLLQVSGSGLLLVSSFGAIHRKQLQPGERYVVDTGHLVAWEGSMQYTLRKAARSIFRSLLSGEGFVAEFTGPGEVLIQTRNLEAFAGLLKPFFPSQGGSGGGFNFGE